MLFKKTNINTVPLILNQIALTGLLFYQNYSSSMGNVGKEELSTLSSRLQELKEERAEMVEKLKDITSQLQSVKDERGIIREKLIDLKEVLKNTPLSTSGTKDKVIEAVSVSDHSLLYTLSSTCLKTFTMVVVAAAVKSAVKTVVTTAVLENVLPSYVLKTLTSIGFREPVVKTFQTDAKSEIGDFTVMAKVTDNVLTYLSVLPHGEQIICGMTALGVYLKSREKSVNTEAQTTCENTNGDPEENQPTTANNGEETFDPNVATDTLKNMTETIDAIDVSQPQSPEKEEVTGEIVHQLRDLNRLLNLPEDFPDY